MPGGRPRKPTALRVLEGNRSKSPLPADEPMPDGEARCPEWLDAEAKKCWRRNADRLARVGLLTGADADGFATYCQAYSTWKRMCIVIQQEGETMESVNSAGKEVVIRRPEVQIMNDAHRQMLALMSRFGLSPADRAKISAPTAKPSDPFDDALSGVGA